jgi:hypothetical protein
MSEATSQAVLAQILSKCWTDANYKAKLLADPAGVLHAEGLSVPQGVELRVVEDTAETVHLVIPARPAELSDEMLDGLAGGGILDELLRGAVPPQPFPVPGLPFPFLR